MPPTRFAPWVRSLLYLACILRVGFVYAASPANPPPPEVAQPPAIIAAATWGKISPHPRLLATADRWDALRSQVKTDPDSRRFFELLVLRADEFAALPSADFKTKTVRDLIRTQGVVLAAVYRLTGEARYLDAARARLVAVAAEPWRGGLDQALICIGFSLVYDWLHPDLTPEERTSFAAVIIAKGLRDSVTHVDGASHAYLWADHNWNQVCNSALALGALATAEHDPALGAHIVNRSIAMIPRATTAYAPDGVYPEGPTYWEFGTTQQVIFMDALRTALGTTAGLEKAPGLLVSSDYVELTTGPTGLPFNFSDARERRVLLPAMLWFARERAMPALARPELAFARQLLDATPPIGAPSQNDGPNIGIGLVLSLLWWQPALLAPSTDPVAPVSYPSVWIGQGVQPVAVLRSSADAQATWLAIKGGTSSHHHAHMDVGSFVLDAGGVRWALDGGMQEYPKVYSGGFSHGELFNLAQNSRRWTVFRIGPDTHNILRFDGAWPLVAGTAPLRALPAPPEQGKTVELDLTPIYAGQAERVLRRATLRPDASILLADEWTTGAQPTRVTWQWLTRAQATPTPDGFLLHQSGQTFELKILEGSGATVAVEEISTPRDPKIDDPNPDLRRLTIRLDTPAHATRRLLVSGALK